MNVTRIRVVMTAAVAVMVFAGGSEMGAPMLSSAGVAAKGPRVQTPDEAREADLRAIAEANGWTLEQARANQRSTEALDEAIDQIVEQYPGILVGSALADDPEAPPTIYLKGPSTPEIEAIVAATGVPITIVADQPYAFEELEERSMRASQAVWALGIPFVSAGTDLAGGGRIPMSIARTTGFSDADIAAIIAALPEDLRADVDLTVVDPPIDALLCPGPTAGASPGASAAPSPANSADLATSPDCIDVPPGWGPLAVVDDPALDGLDAGMGPGRIVITDRCVVLRGKRGPGVTLVWRAGDTRWDPATGEILFVDRDDGLRRVQAGDRVTLGGYSPELGAVDQGPRLAPWLAEPDASCPTELWMVHDVERKADRG